MIYNLIILSYCRKVASFLYKQRDIHVRQCSEHCQRMWLCTVEGLYIENLARDDELNNYSDGTFSHNMEWITSEAIKVINEDSEDVRHFGLACPVFA